MEILFNAIDLRTDFPRNILKKDICFIEGNKAEADRYFEKYNVRSFKPFRTFQLEDDDRYVIVGCTINKSEDQAFCEALHDMQTDMLILGYTDYEEFCDKAFRHLGLKK